MVKMGIKIAAMVEVADVAGIQSQQITIKFNGETVKKTILDSLKR